MQPHDLRSQTLLTDLHATGRSGVLLPELDVPEAAELPERFRRARLDLPEVGQQDVVRHFVRLSRLNYGVDTGFYPLGSCSMKYNPKVNEDVSALPGFRAVHPYQPVETVQGALALMYGLQTYLAEITGMDAVSLEPAAGAHGELTALLCIRAYHGERGESERRTKVIIPSSAHGTNPATAAMCGYQVVSVRADADGDVDLEQLRTLVGPDTAAFMLTLPSTLGLWERNLCAIIETVHAAGGQVYGDGANLNAQLGQVRMGDLGFDAVHLNLHKTFSTPHGGGGPGCGPIAVKRHLASFLPKPVVGREGDRYCLDEPAQSIGRVKGFYGNFGMMVRAYTYIRALGPEGLRAIGENAVLNANYLLALLRDDYEVPFDRACMHEFVLSANRQKARGVRALDIAKRLIDYGFHPPTIYFPLIVDECLMIEPTESETKANLDAFAAAMRAIARESREEPEKVKAAPLTTLLGRLDEATAARKPDLRWRRSGDASPD
jgi:glycine dehydrogenase subunit 2